MFPEKLHEQQEVSPIGCQSKRIVILYFAGLIAHMEIVCKVKIHKAKSAVALCNCNDPLKKNHLF
jgi:hypothetical protein